MKAGLSEPQLGRSPPLLAARPPGSGCKLAASTLPACCWKCGPEGEVPADWDVTQNDYRVVHISVDSCARLEPGRSCLVQAKSWV